MVASLPRGRQPCHQLAVFPGTALPVELGPPRVVHASWPRAVSIRRPWLLKRRWKVSRFVMPSEATYSQIQNTLPWSLRLLPCISRPKYALFLNMHGNEMDRDTTRQLACLGFCDVSQSHS